MPSFSMRRRSASPQLLERLRSELQRALAIMDDAAMTGNLTRLGQAFAGDALSEVRARFSAYQMAGIQVSPFRESLHLEVSGGASPSGPRARVRYRDRTSFLCTGAAPASANDAVQMVVAFDDSDELWRIVSIVEE
ncbi:MAG: hypothetical protein ACYDEA_09160 [Candidatus Dormibacteria bacterium]